MAAGAQRADDPRLLIGRDAREQIGLPHLVGERSIAEFRDIRARQQATRRYLQRLDQMLHSRRGIAGDDLDTDAGTFQPLDGRCRGFLRRIDEKAEAGENELRLIGDAHALRGRRKLAPADGDAAQTLRAFVMVKLLDRGAAAVIQRMHAAFALHLRRQRKNVLGRAFHDQQAATIFLHQHRGTPAVEIERHVGDIAPVAARDTGRSGEDGVIERAALLAFEAAVDRRQLQHPPAVGAVDAGMTGERDPRLRQGSGLVRAQDGHRAYIMDCGEPLHHHLAPGHAHGAAGERDCHDHRQELRRHADRQRQREQEKFENRS